MARATVGVRRALLVASALLVLQACGHHEAGEERRRPVATSAPASDDLADLPAPAPRVEGSRLVDARDGTTYVPAGVNWTSLEYACAQGWGYSVLDAGADADQEARAIAGWGANTVRLPLNEDCWLGTRGVPRDDPAHDRTAEGYRDQVDQLVSAFHEAGLVVVLDLHSRAAVGRPDFGNVAMPDADSVTFWTDVATHFADDPSVMLDLFNEPYSRYDQRAGDWAFLLDWDCWRDGGCRPPVEDDRAPELSGSTYPAVGMADLVAAVRATGARQPLILSGLDYANDLSEWADHLPEDDQLVAGFHAYDFKPCADVGCWDRDLGAVLASGRPVLAAEYGDTSASLGFARSFGEWAAAHGVGALAWAWATDDGDPLALLDRRRRPQDSAYAREVHDLIGTLAGSGPG